MFLCNIQGANALYLNEGDFRFKYVSGPQEMKDVISTGATLVDVDGDGDKDLLVNGVQIGTRLFLNDGAGGFEQSKNSGLESSGTTTSMRFCSSSNTTFVTSAGARALTIKFAG